MGPVFTAVNHSYGDRLFIELQVQYKKTTSSEHVSPVHVVLVSLLVDQLSGLFLLFFGRPKKICSLSWIFYPVFFKKWEIDRTIGRPRDWAKPHGRPSCYMNVNDYLSCSKQSTSAIWQVLLKSKWSSRKDYNPVWPLCDFTIFSSNLRTRVFYFNI